MKDALLIELLTEELPPKSLESLSAAFAERLFTMLNNDGLVTVGSSYATFATPRRLAVLIDGVLSEASDNRVMIPGPPVSAALDKEGRPTPALVGFARKCGIAPDALRRERTDKGEIFACVKVVTGSRLAHVLDLHITDALRKLPVAKLMRWGAGEDEFVRPVHGLVMLHGRSVVSGTLFGLESTDITEGHRLLGVGPIRIPNASDYADILEREGDVIASFERRRDVIAAALEARSKALGAIWYGHRDLSPHELILLFPGERAEISDLLNEVTALVESPAVYEGRFDEAFLALPQECLILSMKQHQKYFPLLDAATGKLLNRFLIVSNLVTDKPKNIIGGNERVLRARLADAKFFYDQDRKTKLAERVERLGSVVYHNKLGTQLERVQRVRKLAGTIAGKLHADVTKTERAAWLCKADLVTDMVGEFPELQGIMGQYYALHDGEDTVVARAIEAHYRPRFAADSLPDDNIGRAVALADKLDTLVGIYGIGLVPTGDKDPFGLRRQALGVLRLLSEGDGIPLDLMDLLQQAQLGFAPGVIRDGVGPDLHGFMLERLRNYLREHGFGADEIDAVLSQNPTRIDLVVPRLKAVQAFRQLPEAESLASANKRIRNILKKTTFEQVEADPTLLNEPAEKALHAATSQLLPKVRSLVDDEDYAEALRVLAGVRGEVDTFFDQVMVMTDEPLIRNNRLALLAQLEALMNQVADISRLAQ